MNKIKYNRKYWTIILCLLVWLPFKGMAQTEQFEMVVEKVDGTLLPFKITNKYPVLEYMYGGESGVNNIIIQMANGPTFIPCSEIKRIYTRIVGGAPEPQEDTFEEDGAGYVKQADNSVAIADDKGVTGEYQIPEIVTHDGKTYTVTAIGEEAFMNNTSITQVTIPSTITSIGAAAFAGCTSLEAIIIFVEEPIDLSKARTRADGSSVFEGVDKNKCILYVPDGSVEKYKVAEIWKEFANIQGISTLAIREILWNNGKGYDIYDIRGQKVRQNATSLKGLSKGIYIINGKKVVK